MCPCDRVRYECIMTTYIHKRISLAFPYLHQPQNAESAADWTFDHNELSAAFNERTKIIILNNPHNPIGKVYTR